MDIELSEQLYKRPTKSLVLMALAIATILSTMLLSYMAGGNLVNIGFAGALTLMALIYLVVGRRELWISPEIVMVMIWLAYSLIPSLFAPDQEQAMFKMMTMIQVLILSVVILQVCIWQGSTRIFIWTYILAVCASYIITFTPLNELVVEVQAEVEGSDSMVRTASTLGNANTFGVVAVLAQAFVVILISMKSTTARERVLAVVSYFILAGAVINSGSRTALAGSLLLTFGMAWVFSLWKIHKLGNVIKWLVIIGALIGGLYYFLKDVEVVQERFDIVVSESKIEMRMADFFDLFTKDEDEEMIERSGDSIGNRLGLAKMAWDIVNEYPFGVGLDNFKIFSGVYAHSNYLELLADTGFIGTFLYYLIYVLLVLKLLKLWSRIKGSNLPKALILGVFILSVMDIANVSYYTKPVWIFLIIIIATAELFQRQAVLIKQRQNHRVLTS
ncbi:MAG: O-antigen ligase family protein [Gammaproteobacteria bacterium]|nr:O-antigen ligase family protein [Gammaproteobacteria bacterium]